MNASYKRYWEPNYLQVTSLSLVAGALATAVTYPMDFLKTVIQHRNEAVGMRGNNAYQMGTSANRIMRQMHERGGGFSQFYTGFQAHLYARLGYLFVRNTIYKIIYDATKPRKPFTDLTIKEKMLISGFAGAVGAWVTSPLELIAIRQALDTQIRPDWRRNYSSIGSAIEALKAEGNLFKGSVANVMRHLMLNVSLTYTYDFVHERMWVVFGDYGHVKPVSLAVTALVGSIVSLPFDNMRTKIMQQQLDPRRNRLQYNGMTELFVQMYNVEGSKLSPWVGFYTYFTSMLVYTALTVALTDEVNDYWKQGKGLESWQM